MLNITFNCQSPFLLKIYGASDRKSYKTIAKRRTIFGVNKNPLTDTVLSNIFIFEHRILNKTLREWMRGSGLTDIIIICSFSQKKHRNFVLSYLYVFLRPSKWLIVLNNKSSQNRLQVV